jgi:murein L,D-transpeptidase YcbB/YkuD
MRRYGIIVLILALSISLAACSKKQESLEEMQQPMSPEDLNRIKVESQAVEANITKSAAALKNAPLVEVKPEVLLPSGPFKPSSREIQTALKNAGFYAGAVDGKIGPMSKRAIEDFQKANNLQADGKVGPKTWAVLSVFLNAS